MKFVNIGGIQLLSKGDIYFSNSTAKNKLSIALNALGPLTNNYKIHFSDTVDHEPNISNDHFYIKMF